MEGNGGDDDDGPKVGKKAKQEAYNKKMKKKGIKVVYISNPMKVETSAAKFMALVQHLTGQHAHFPHPSNFHHPNLVMNHHHSISSSNSNSSPSSLGAELPVAEEDFLRGGGGSGGFSYDDFDYASFFHLP